MVVFELLLYLVKCLLLLEMTCSFKGFRIQVVDFFRKDEKLNSKFVD